MLLKYKHGNNLKDLKLKYEETGLSQILLAKAKKKELSNYGVVKIKKGVIESIVEKPKVDKTPSNLFAAGRYIFTPEIFNYLESIPVGKAGELQLTDAIAAMLSFQDVYAHPFKGARFDCGSRLGMMKATMNYAFKDDRLRAELLAYVSEFDLCEY